MWKNIVRGIYMIKWNKRNNIVFWTIVVVTFISFFMFKSEKLKIFWWKKYFFWVFLWFRDFQHVSSTVDIEAQPNTLTARLARDNNNLMIITWVGLEPKRHYTPSQHDTDCKPCMQKASFPTQPASYSGNFTWL